MKDEELNHLLAEFRNKEVSSFQVKKWKHAVDKSRVKKQKSQSPWLQYVACSILSFMLGAIAFNTLNNAQTISQISQNESEDATIEYVFAKNY